MNNPKPETVIKVICAICLGIVLLVSYILNNRIENLQSQFDELMDNYTEEIEKRAEAETRYETLRENLDKAYGEYLFAYFYILGDEDITHDRAVESAVFIHDYLDLMK